MQLYRYSQINFVEKCLIEHMAGQKTDIEVSKELDTGCLVTVREEILLDYINYSYMNSNKLLVNLVDVLQESSITNKIFDMLLLYPNQDIQNAVIISLSHMKLRSSQLLRLCKTELTFECFYTLGELLYLDEKVTNDEFSSYLDFFQKSKFRDHVNDFVNSYLMRSDNNNKEVIIKKYF